MSEQQPIRVLIVDDHAIVRKGIKTLLHAFPDMELVGEAANGAEAIHQCLQARPDVILMDLVMPGINGISAIQTIRKTNTTTQIVALTNFDEEELVKGAVEAGAVGYLLKNIAADELAKAIRLANAGKATIAPEATQVLFEAITRTPLGHDLTEREHEVLTLLVKGLTNAQIAEKLRVSPLTIKNHVAHILTKLGVATRTEAATLSVQHKIVHLD